MQTGVYIEFNKKMTIRDPFIETLVKDKTPIVLGGVKVTVEKNPLGSCDGCYFLGKQCPSRAITICCSNGGNIFKLVEEIK